MTATETMVEATRAELVETENRLARARGELEELNGHRDRSEVGDGLDYGLLTENVQRVRAYEAKIDQLKATLARLASPVWGHCEKCGALIDPERLNAVPETTLCIKCQRKKEERNRGIFSSRMPVRHA